MQTEPSQKTAVCRCGKLIHRNSNTAGFFPWLDAEGEGSCYSVQHEPAPAVPQAEEEVSEQDDADGPPCLKCGLPILECKCLDGFLGPDEDAAPSDPLIAREQRLEDALRDIREMVNKRQLPITQQIWDIADRALEDK